MPHQSLHYASRLNSGVRSCQCKFSREKRLSLASRSCSAPLRSRFTHNSPPSARITRGAPDFIRRRPSRFSCCHAVLRGSHAGARGNKPCRVYLRASVRFDGVKAGSQQKRPAGHDLTIRSSRVRFAASSRCGKLVHLAVAAPLPGLAQALGLIGSNMAFQPEEREALLAVKGVGPTVVQRLEQIGFSSLRELARADALEVVSSAAGLVGSTCWKNSPQARAAIQSAIDMARSRQ